MDKRLECLAGLEQFQKIQRAAEEQDLRRFRRERTKTVFHGAYIRTDKEKTVHCRSERRRRCENAGGHEPTCGEIAFVPDKRL